MTGNELKRRLAAKGAKFEQKKKHLLIRFQGKSTVMPRHDSKQIATGTLKAILNQLGIDKL